MLDTITIGERVVGDGRPVFIIAEAGVNHNGDLGLAKRLVDAARDCGADAVKFQTWITEKLVAPDARMAEYQKRNVGREESQFAMLKRLELSQDQFREINTYAHAAGILFLSTPDEEDSADFLDRLGVPAFKIGSAEVTNLRFLRHVAGKGKPVILSTGMSTLGEVEAAVHTIAETKNRQLALLHCVSDYPADPADCNLRAMDTLKDAFRCPIGFSDHTPGIDIAVAAVARGASVIEKHLTLDKTMPGPDHVMSLDVAEFKRMVRAVRSVEAALGTGRKEPAPAELATKQVVQKAIVALRDVPAGKKLEMEDLALRRTSGGLPSQYLEMLIGREARCLIKANQMVSLDMVS